MFNFNEAIVLSLRTWYPVDHELHNNPHHPLGKMLGKWGKLLDNYMNSVYKPSYVFEPEDELGDIWYYIRILYYQQSQQSTLDPKVINMISSDVDYLIASVIHETSQSLLSFYRGSIERMYLPLDINYSILLKICKLQSITMEQLTQSNWEKLKPGSERGDEWARVRVSTDYVGGKVTNK